MIYICIAFFVGCLKDIKYLPIFYSMTPGIPKKKQQHEIGDCLRNVHFDCIKCVNENA